jgi:hypothetical protein
MFHAMPHALYARQMNKKTQWNSLVRYDQEKRKEGEERRATSQGIKVSRKTTPFPNNFAQGKEPKVSLRL